MAPLFSLDEGATLNMELMVDIGKGYQPAHSRRKWYFRRGEKQGGPRETAALLF
jgi:DNA-directed RNA polymerase alpha subunit